MPSLPFPSLRSLRSRRRWWGLLVVAVVLGAVLSLAGSGDEDGTEEAEAAAATSSTTRPNPPTTRAPVELEPPASEGEVEELLALLTIAPEEQPPGYDRDRFPHWASQGAGCDTRDRVLIEESLSRAQVDVPCTVVAGDWRSPYDGVEVTDPAELEVDHVVALHEAWQSGAAHWSEARREAFANDLSYDGTLVAVTVATNRSKSDRDPAEWRPPAREAWCRFALDWVTVKVRWGLSADEAERRSLADLLATCPEREGTEPG